MEEGGRDNVLHELAQQAKHGDEDALERLLTDTEIKNVIYGLANKMVGRDNADDVYQEVCLRIYQKIRVWQERSKITTWIYALTKNICRNFVKKAQRENKKARDWSVIVISDREAREHDEPEQFRIVLKQERTEIIRDALGELGERCNQMLTLYFFKRLPKHEIMKVVGLQKSFFSKKWNACFKALRRKTQKIMKKQRKK